MRERIDVSLCVTAEWSTSAGDFLCAYIRVEG